MKKISLSIVGTVLLTSLSSSLLGNVTHVQTDKKDKLKQS
ncbi:Uncharacterised protein [Staphylococcus saccharolyticus]|uniref:Uncharacterized protein n=1 Tax=Staphylococcus saccharolyticus TaxID=33028 RepID=A0A380H8Y5_9STAP|nr:Uncharacterised protein [Staphylococcus saccharolyticus]